jgi:hypothetical protein
VQDEQSFAVSYVLSDDDIAVLRSGGGSHRNVSCLSTVALVNAANQGENAADA